MCLAKVFVGTWSQQPVIQDIAHIRIHEDTDKVELETLFGEVKIMPGKLSEINFTTSKILMVENSVPRKP